MPGSGPNRIRENLKLNTDGSSLGNQGSGGGVGSFEIAQVRLFLRFSKTFDNFSYNEAELQAILEDLLICK